MKTYKWIAASFIVVMSAVGCAPPDQCTRYCNVCSPGDTAAFDICYEFCATPIDRTVRWTYGADACESATSATRECAIRTNSCGADTCQSERDFATMQCSQDIGP